tara:strand:+ start:204 stop:1424 length:1221 start_codon:yes stop_codon:yes gene_type:complete
VSDIGLSDVGQSDIASSGLSSGMPDMGSDYDTASFDEAYDTDDFTQEERDFASAIGAQTGGFGDDNTAQTIANFLARPQLGLNRSNIIGSRNFDPTFAAALNISRGLNPGVGSPLVRPSYLSPQVPGEFMTTPFGEADMVRPMFFSQGEKFLQQTLPEIVRSGPIARLARGIGSIFQDGLNFAKDATAGIKLPSLSTLFPDTGGDSEPTVNRTAKVEEEKEPEFVREDVEGVPRFGTRTMDELQLVPDNVVVPAETYGGIATINPNNFMEGYRSIGDALNDLQLIPSEFRDVPTDLGSGMRIAPGSGADRFKFTTSTGANLPGLNPLGNIFDIIDARNLEKEVGRLTDEEREFLAGRRNRIVGTKPVFMGGIPSVTTTPNFSVPGFRSRSMSEKEAEEIKRRLGVS